MPKQIAFLLSLLITLLIIPGIALSGTIQLPQTGQTKCYDELGTEIPCAGTGQDGDILAGVPWPNPRFTDNGNETMTDNLTGLMWAKNANFPDATRTWQQALDYIASLNSSNYLGFNDWSLPNLNELKSLVNANVPFPAYWVIARGFINVRSGPYWSSTTGIGGTYSTDSAWTVNMFHGDIIYYNKVSNSLRVWPVRSSGQPGLIQLPKTGQTVSYAAGDDGDLERGVAWPNPRFTEIWLGTVTDNLTGLMWAKKATIPLGYKTWQEALDYVASLNSSNYLGFNDWSLPNLNELRSLINPAVSDTAQWLWGQGFEYSVRQYDYWSSSTYVGTTNRGWTIDMWHGGSGSASKVDNETAVLPVRSGETGAFNNLIVSKSGSGSGTVTSTPAVIDCGFTCSASFSINQSVTLTATPYTSPTIGSTFTGWSGDCTDTGDCTVTMDAPKSVTAEFTLLTTTTISTTTTTTTTIITTTTTTTTTTSTTTTTNANTITITLAPAADGTKSSFGNSSTSTSHYVSKRIHVFSSSDPIRGTGNANTGLIEFDISALSSLTPGTFSAQLLLDGVVYSSHKGYPNALQVFKMDEGSEDGILGGQWGNLIGDLSYNIFSYGTYTATIDVTQALESDIMNLATNTFSGFILKWKNLEFHWDNFSPYGGSEPHSDTPDADFNDSYYGLENAPKLIITNNSVTETSTSTTLSTSTTSSTTTTNPPTAITLSSFTAKAKAGKVMLRWKTGTEINNIGFNIYRSETENGWYVKINGNIIPAKGSSIHGAVYKFKDSTVQPGKTYFYKLEDIDSVTGATQHGPKSVTLSFKKGKK